MYLMRHNAALPRGSGAVRADERRLTADVGAQQPLAIVAERTRPLQSGQLAHDGAAQRMLHFLKHAVDDR